MSLSNEKIKELCMNFYNKNILINLTSDILQKYDDVESVNPFTTILIELEVPVEKIDHEYYHQSIGEMTHLVMRTLYETYEGLLFELGLLKNYKEMETFFNKKAEKECRKNIAIRYDSTTFNEDPEVFPEEYDEYALFLIPNIELIKELLPKEYYELGQETLKEFEQKNNNKSTLKIQ